MRIVDRTLTPSLVLLALALSGCATTVEDIVKTPGVELRDVEVLGLGFNGQTFLLSFDVENPNPFALPVSSVSYSLHLDGQRFASGQTPGEFSVPAGGRGEFAISVDLNLLHSAPQLLSIVRQGVRKDVAYELDGRFALDLPLAPAVSFRNSGSIRLMPASL